MKHLRSSLAAAALALTVPAWAQDEPKAEPTPNEIVNSAPLADWVEIAPEDLLVMELAPDAAGAKREVVIQLVPPPFSQGWVDNIHTLAKDHWWDGTNIYRVQDNYVTQWGGGAVEKEDPKGLEEVPESEYTHARFHDGKTYWPGKWEDPYAHHIGFRGGFPVAWNADAIWTPHCYGMVGVARGLDNTGSGSDLYTVIGQAPRQLDRNIALVGRVISGMEFLSSLPRGHGKLGFYDDDEAAKRVPIVWVRLASDIAEKDRPSFEFLSTESDSFAAYVHARANRHDAFYKVPAGGVDICNVPVPVRQIFN